MPEVGSNDNQSVPDQAPWLGPELPVYPHLAQLCRVTGVAIPGTNPRVYPAIIQQFVPPLGLRDRESCYVLEANNIKLEKAIYDARLIGSYAGEPLYATHCCPG